jgi:hypothetical protein
MGRQKEEGEEEGRRGRRGGAWRGVRRRWQGRKGREEEGGVVHHP